MANLILPDSNVYISVLRAGGDPFRDFAAGIDEHDWEFATCGMVMLEVCRGLRDPGVLKRFRERFALMIFVPTTNQIWDRAGQLAWSLDRQGRVLPAPDILIAAHALTTNAILLTGDAHFGEIPGLKVLKNLP